MLGSPPGLLSAERYRRAECAMNDSPILRLSILGVIVAMFVALVVATVVRSVKAQHRESEQRLVSLQTWWIQASLLTLALAAGAMGIHLLLGLISLLGLREYLRLIPSSEINWTTEAAGFLLVPIHYASLVSGYQAPASVFFPLGGWIVVSLTRLLSAEPDGFIRSTSQVYWGLMLTTFSISHAVMLVSESETATSGGIEAFLFLILVTEINDIAQALVGRVWGRHRIVPVVSPNKSWEGLCGGVSVTLLVAIALAWWLELFGNFAVQAQALWMALGAGLLIGLSGFLGDVLVSAIKRDAGVKDSGTLMAGQGGVLDRFDSLALSAPLFYYYYRFLSA